MAEIAGDTDVLQLATELTVAWLSNPNTRAGVDEVPAFLATIQAALTGLGSGEQQNDAAAQEQPQFTPAVSVRKSLANPDHIISLIDGKPYKTLRRHLARHGLTPEQYRQRYGLKPDYPMTSDSYSQVRRDMAKRIGLGRKAGGSTQAGEADQAGAEAAAKPARGRRRKANEETA